MHSSRSGSAGFTDTGSVDAKTGLEIEQLRFAPEAEAEFQKYFIQRSLVRARWATAIYLALVAVVTAINMRGSMAPPEYERRHCRALTRLVKPQTVNLLRRKPKKKPPD